MKSVVIEILNQVYDETLRDLKGVIKEKEYLPGNEWMRFYRQGISNLKYRNLPKKNNIMINIGNKMIYD